MRNWIISKNQDLSRLRVFRSMSLTFLDSMIIVNSNVYFKIAKREFKCSHHKKVEVIDVNEFDLIIPQCIHNENITLCLINVCNYLFILKSIKCRLWMNLSTEYIFLWLNIKSFKKYTFSFFQKFYLWEFCPSK